MENYTPPQFGLDAFHCPLCNVYAHQYWFDDVAYYDNGYKGIESLSASFCKRCSGFMFWYHESIIHPNITSAPLPSPDMPEEIARDYEEARKVFDGSAKASAALLRLVVQKLCVHLGQPGKDLNTDIASLVVDGLPNKIQKSLDIVRVVGNNAVHPGVIDLNDQPQTASVLFNLVNLIVDHMITQPRIVEELYENLPDASKDQIKKRDEEKVKVES